MTRQLLVGDDLTLATAGHWQHFLPDIITASAGLLTLTLGTFGDSGSGWFLNTTDVGFIYPIKGGTPLDVSWDVRYDPGNEDAGTDFNVTLGVAFYTLAGAAIGPVHFSPGIPINDLTFTTCAWTSPDAPSNAMFWSLQVQTNGFLFNHDKIYGQNPSVIGTPFATPRLRQFPRDDTLGHSPRPRQQSISVQATARQGWQGTYR